MSRFWLRRKRLVVTCHGDGTPTTFLWHGRVCEVDYIAKQWRIDVDWWRTRVRRDCYKLSTTNGLLVIIYQDLLDGEWYLQRVYD